MPPGHCQGLRKAKLPYRQLNNLSCHIGNLAAHIPTGFSTGVAKKELSTANLVVEKAAKLDRDTFGVAVGQGPWQRRIEEIGGIKPLAFGQFAHTMSSGVGVFSLRSRSNRRRVHIIVVSYTALLGN